MIVQCGIEDRIYGDIHYNGVDPPSLAGNQVALANIMKLQKPGQDIQTFLLSLPTRMYGALWAYVIDSTVTYKSSKFNPYHDERGLFTSGESMGPVSGQSELPGMPGITGGMRQPQLFGKPSTGSFTAPIVARGTTVSGIHATPEQLLNAKDDNGQKFGRTYNNTYKVMVGKDAYFLKEYNVTAWGRGEEVPGGENQPAQEQTARDVSVLMGIGNMTADITTFQSDNGTDYLAQKWNSDMTTYSQDEEAFNNAVSNLSDAQATTAHLFEYSTGDGDHTTNGGNYVTDSSGHMTMLDFSLAFNQENQTGDAIQHQSTLLYDALTNSGRDLNKDALNVFVSNIPAYLDIAKKDGLSSQSLDELSQRLDILSTLSLSGNATWDDLVRATGGDTGW